MNTTILEYSFQPPTQDDAQAAIDLMARCEIAEYGDSDSDLEELLHDWSKIDLEKDAWLVTNNRDELIGYGAVIPWFSALRFDFFIDPSHQGLEVGRAILDRIEARGREKCNTREPITEASATVYIAHVNLRDQELLTTRNYHLVKYHFQMQIHLDKPPTPTPWPEGIIVRTTQPGQDDYAIYQLINAAFARPDRDEPTFEEWKSFMMRADIFEAELWQLALSGEKLAGACLSFQYPELGWVRQLGVDETWCRRGLGSALLTNAFNLFYQRGHQEVGLTVASDNLNAQAFYKNLGMKKIRQYDEYEKLIRA